MRTKTIYSTLIVALISLSSCDSINPGDFEQEHVIEAYLYADEPLPWVDLTKTVDIDDTFDRNVLGTNDAIVNLFLLDENGQVEETFSYSHGSNQIRGRYFPNQDAEVLPLRRYRIEVDFTDGSQQLSSETLVPGEFHLVNFDDSTAVYKSDDQLQFIVTRSEYPGRQSAYKFTTEALDLEVDNLTPLAESFYDEDDDLADFAKGSSPVLFEGNYDINADGTVTIQLPWIAIGFYGRNVFTASALDENIYDFLRSQEIQSGGSTLGPGEIPPVLEHVNNGRGLFASMARIEKTVTVLRE